MNKRYLIVVLLLTTILSARLKASELNPFGEMLDTSRASSFVSWLIKSTDDSK